MKARGKQLAAANPMEHLPPRPPQWSGLVFDRHEPGVHNSIHSAHSGFALVSSFFSSLPLPLLDWNCPINMSSTTTLSQQEEWATKTVKQNPPQPSPQQQNVSLYFMSPRTLGTLVTLMVVFYAPQAFTYFFTDLDHPVTWTDRIMSLTVSDKFAYGKGSGHGAHEAVLLRNYAAMLSHSITGSVAIVLGLAQFNQTLQFRYPVVHRNLGRLYYLCAMFITWSSSSFLYDTIPKNQVFSGETFGLILATLAFSTFTTMNLAVYAVWNHDIRSHREFMALNYSLMLSAPLLRVFWIVIGQFWDETKSTINLYSGVLAGPFLLTAPMFYLRRRYSRPANSVLIGSKIRLAAAVSGLIGLLYLIPKLPALDEWDYKTATLVSVIPQWTFEAVIFTVLAQTAKRRGDMGAYTTWVTFQNGLLCGPAWGVLAYHLCHNQWGFSAGSIGLSTVFGGWNAGLFFSYMVYVFSTSTFANPYNRTIKAK